MFKDNNYNVVVRNYTNEDLCFNELYDYLKGWEIEKLKIGDILYYSTSSEFYNAPDFKVVNMEAPDFDKGYIILETIY